MKLLITLALFLSFSFSYSSITHKSKTIRFVEFDEIDLDQILKMNFFIKSINTTNGNLVWKDITGNAQFSSLSVFENLRKGISIIHKVDLTGFRAVNLTGVKDSIFETMKKNKISPYYASISISNIFNKLFKINITPEEVMLMPKGYVIIDKSILREEPMLLVSTLLHEGRHSEGKKFDHVPCLNAEIIKVIKSKNSNFCDNSLIGPNGVQVAFMYNLVANCTSCTKYQKALAREATTIEIKYLNPLFDPKKTTEERKDLLSRFKISAI